MSNANQSPSGQPANENMSEELGAQPDSTFDVSAAIANLDEANLRRVLGFEELQETPSPTLEPEQQPLEPVSETLDHGGEQPPELAQSETRPKGRISVRSLPADEQKQLAVAVEMVRVGDATTVYEALQQLAGTPPEIPASTSDEIAPEPITPPLQTPAAVAELEAKIADLRAQRKAANADFDTVAASELTDQIEDAIADLGTAKAHAVVEKQALGAWQQQYLSAVDVMEEKYPDATDETTPFYQLLDDKVTAAEARKDPALNDPNYILKFAEQVATVLRQSSPRPMSPPSKPRVPVGASVAPGHSAVDRQTPDQIRELIKTASLEEIGAVIFDH
jgi:hypothetical protein